MSAHPNKQQDLNHILTSPPSQILPSDDTFSRSPKKRDPTMLAFNTNSEHNKSTHPTVILDNKLPYIPPSQRLDTINGNSSKLGASYMLDPRRTIFENRTEGNEKMPKKTLETLKDLNGPPRYDYSSQLLMYIPEDMHYLSEQGRTNAFNSFNHLSQSTKNSHQKLLEGVLKEIKPQKGSEIYDNKPARFNSFDNMDSVKKMLELNKLQKRYYSRQIEVEKKHVVLPLIQKVQESKSKSRRMPHVKKLPSRNVYNGNNMDAILDSPSPYDRSSEFYNSFDKGNTYNTLSEISPVHAERRSSNRSGSMDERTSDQPFGQATYKVFWNYDRQDKNMWKPYCREGHTMTTVGRQVILYGGISNCLMTEITVYDPTKNTWSKPQVTGDIPLSGRHGHTALEYRRTLIIFGGEREFNPTLNFRECMNDTYMYIPEKNEWKYMRSAGSLINSRRHHAAAIYESNMYVYGGITNEGNYIKDVWSFNLKTCNWNQLDVEGDRENGIAFHAMTTCAISRNGVYRDKDKSRNFEEGLYVFGGKDSEGKTFGTLKMLPIKSKELKWKYLATKGVAPTARYNHSMIFYEPLAILVLYGGRNDSMFEATQDICLRDLRILSLETLTWSATLSFGEVPQMGRYHHAVACYGTKMLIFGGVSLQSYANDEVKSVELNPGEVHKLVKEQQQMDGIITTEYKKPKKPVAPILKDRTQEPEYPPQKIAKQNKSVSISVKTWQPVPLSKFHEEDARGSKDSPMEKDSGKAKMMRALSKIMST